MATNRGGAACSSSLGFRTDLMLLTLQGSITEQRDGYLCVRTPSNPEF